MDNVNADPMSAYLLPQQVATGPSWAPGPLAQATPCTLPQQFPPGNHPPGFPAPVPTCPIASALSNLCNGHGALVQHFQMRAADSDSSFQAQEVARRVCNVLGSLRDHMNNPFWNRPEDASPAARVLAAIRRKDFVVYMMLSEQVECEPGDISTCGQELYIVANNFQAYVDAFGIHLPKKLSKAVLPIVAQFAYLKPSPETIAYRSDSSVFREELKKRQMNSGGTIGISSGLEKLDALTGGLHGGTSIHC